MITLLKNKNSDLLETCCYNLREIAIRKEDLQGEWSKNFLQDSVRNSKSDLLL